MAVRAIPFISLKSKGFSEFAQSPSSFDEDVENVDFDHFIQTSCKIFECPITVRVARKIICHIPPKRGKWRQESKSNRKKSIQPPVCDTESPDSSLEFRLEPEQNKLLITAVYEVNDNSYELVEIIMFKYPYAPIPRVLMKVIALKVPFTRNLTKFTIKQCCIDTYTIYELNKILTISNLSDICLDHSPLKEANYDILLSDPSSLRSLSLSRCNINDIVCEKIASRLHYQEPAEPTLLFLNLSSNHITDVGLKHLGEALRTNRHLRYLNIADNHVSDDGAKYIFEVLAEFPLSVDEIQEKNRCYMHYLKNREMLYRKYMLDLVSNKKPARKTTLLGKVKPTTKRQKFTHNVSDEHLKIKAGEMALKTAGPFEHPFCPSMLTVKEGRSHCIGNFTLCYLNLRYNNLTYQSVQRLAAVARHQKMHKNEKLCGLVKVLLEGNYVPEGSDEYIMINKDIIRATSKLNIKQVDKMKPAGRYMALT